MGTFNVNQIFRSSETRCADFGSGNFSTLPASKGEAKLV
jgi:hypothetical protein